MKTLTTFEQWDIWLQIAAKGFPIPQNDADDAAQVTRATSGQA